MKNRILLSIGLICSFMGMKAQGQNTSFQNTCVTNASAIGNCASAIGDSAKAYGFRSTAIGYRSLAFGSGSFAIGPFTKAGIDTSSSGGWAFGYEAQALGRESLAFGSTIQAADTQNIVIGMGTYPYLINSIKRSLMIGMNSDVATFYMSDAGGCTTAYSNIGIATNAPSARMHINGALRLGENGSGTNGSLVFENTATTNTFTINSGPTAVAALNWTLPATQGANLEVLTNNGTGGLSWAAPTTSATAWQLLGNTGTNSSNNYLGTTDTVDVVFRTNAIERMRITKGSQGNVGIGTQTPAQKLHVVAKTVNYSGVNTGYERIARFGVGDNSDAFFQIWNKASADSSFAPSFYGISSTQTEEGLDFRATLLDTTLDVGDVPVMTFNSRIYTGPAITTRPLFMWTSNTNKKMLMNAEGNLGIGTITPKNRLDVEGGMAVGASYSGSTPSAPTNGAVIQGNVGIGTSSPGYRLDVSGGGVGTVVINTSGDVAAAGIVLDSDQMFKTNVDTISNALSIIEQLQPKSYFFDTINFNGPGKFDFQSVKQYGFIAQELEETLPELVHTMTKSAYIDTLGNIINGEYQYKALNYIALIPILSKAIQELSFKNDSLIGVVAESSSVINGYQNQIEQLTANNQHMQEEIQQIKSLITACCGTSGAEFRLNEDIESPQSKFHQDVQLADSERVVLEQNVPNPFAENTFINYSIDEKVQKAAILFYNAQGRLIRSVEVNGRGPGQLNVFAPDLSSGIYTYSLVIDGQISATKKMVKTK